MFQVLCLRKKLKSRKDKIKNLVRELDKAHEQLFMHSFEVGKWKSEAKINSDQNIQDKQLISEQIKVMEEKDTIIRQKNQQIKNIEIGIEKAEKNFQNAEKRISDLKKSNLEKRKKLSRKNFQEKNFQKKFKRRKKTKVATISKVIKAAKKSTKPQFTRNF